MGTVLIRRGDGQWREPGASAYEAEDALQDLLSKHPQLIPGVKPGSMACREFQTDAGRTDIVVVEPDGSITLVECKLDNNPQVRREIVGQIFDYASRLGEMGIEEFDAQWTRRAGSSLFRDEEVTDFDLREALAENLAASRFRLILAVDAINQPLRRMVEYLNKVTRDDTTVIAVEYARYVDGDVEILTPQTYGEDLAEVKTARQNRDWQTWNWEDLLDWAGEHEPSSSVLLRHLDACMAEISFLFRSGRSRNPTAIYCHTTADGLELRPIQMSIASNKAGSYIAVELNFSQWAATWLASGHDPQALIALQKRWSEIPALTGAMRTILAGEGEMRRSIPFAQFDRESQRLAADALGDFISTT
jgi:hypothetical protein